MRFWLITRFILYGMLGHFVATGNITQTIAMSTLIIATYLEERRD
jgi:hypothetical protein